MLRLRRIHGGYLLGSGTFGCVFAPPFQVVEFEEEEGRQTHVKTKLEFAGKIALKIVKRDKIEARFRDYAFEVYGESLFRSKDPSNFFHVPFLGRRRENRIRVHVTDEIPLDDFHKCFEGGPKKAEQMGFKIFSEAPFPVAVPQVDREAEFPFFKSAFPAILMPRISSSSVPMFRAIELARSRDLESKSMSHMLNLWFAIVRHVLFGLRVMDGSIVHGDLHLGNVMVNSMHNFSKTTCTIIDFGKTRHMNEKISYKYLDSSSYLPTVFGIPEVALCWTSILFGSPSHENLFDLKDVAEINDMYERCYSSYAPSSINRFVLVPSPSKGLMRHWFANNTGNAITAALRKDSFWFKNDDFVNNGLFGKAWNQRMVEQLKSVYRSGSKSLFEDITRKYDLIVFVSGLIRQQLFSVRSLRLPSSWPTSIDDPPPDGETERDKLRRLFCKESRWKISNLTLSSFCMKIDRFRVILQDHLFRLVKDTVLKRLVELDDEEEAEEAADRHLEVERRASDDDDEKESRKRKEREEEASPSTSRRTRERLEGGDGDDDLLRKFWELLHEFDINSIMEQVYFVKKMHMLCLLVVHPIHCFRPFPLPFFEAILSVMKECANVVKLNKDIELVFQTLDEFKDRVRNVSRSRLGTTPIHVSGFRRVDGAKKMLTNRRLSPEVVEDLTKSAEISNLALSLVLGRHTSAFNLEKELLEMNVDELLALKAHISTFMDPSTSFTYCTEPDGTVLTFEPGADPGSDPSERELSDSFDRSEPFALDLNPKERECADLSDAGIKSISKFEDKRGLRIAAQSTYGWRWFGVEAMEEIVTAAKAMELPETEPTTLV